MARKKNCLRCNKPKSQCKCGRPTVFTSDILQKLETAYSNDCTDGEASVYAGVSVSALYEYQKKNPKFKERKEALKLKPNIRARKTIVENLEDVGTAKWWAERKIRHEFASRQELTGADGGPLEVELTKDKYGNIARREAGVHKAGNKK